MLRLLCSAKITFVITCEQATAQDIRNEPETGTQGAEIEKKTVGVSAIQNLSFRLKPDASATLRPCPPNSRPANAPRRARRMNQPFLHSRPGGSGLRAA